MPRIVEALQSNVWTGMEFCTDSRPSLMASAAVAGGSKGGGGGGGDGNVGGTGSATGSSERGGEPAATSPSMGGGEQEVVSFGSTLTASIVPMYIVVRVGKFAAKNTPKTVAYASPIPPSHARKSGEDSSANGTKFARLAPPTHRCRRSPPL